MNRNTLHERDNSLPTVDYTPLLKAIKDTLKKEPSLFQVNPEPLQGTLNQSQDAPKHLQIAIAQMALHVTQELQREKFKDIAPFLENRGTQFSTVNFADTHSFREFRTQLDEIQALLQSQLEQSIKAKLGPGATLEYYVKRILSTFKSFTSRQANHLSYPFDAREPLQKRRLHMQAGKKYTGSGTRLVGHKLTIRVSHIRAFGAELAESLINKLEDDDEFTKAEIERIRTVITNRVQRETGEFSELKRIISHESLGRLQKEAKILYLEYLQATMKRYARREQGDNAPEGSGYRLLTTLAQRLRRLDDFINAGRADDYYQVSYAGYGVNLRDLFSRADAFDMLPIISDIEGSLGETYDHEKGEQEFTTGIKLKLNGGYRTYESVYEYYVNLLDPSADEHIRRLQDPDVRHQRFVEKVLKLALLYYFVFRNMDDPTYDPLQAVEEDLLADLRRTDEDAEKFRVRRLRWLSTGLNRQATKSQLAELREALEQLIKKAGTDFETQTTPLHLTISDSILEWDPERIRTERKFIKDEALKELATLKYISIQEPTAAGNALGLLPVTITLEPMYYYDDADDKGSRQFSMQYQTDDIVFLPVLFIPDTPPSGTDTLSLLEIGRDYYRRYRHILIPYSTHSPFENEPRGAFVYNFTFLLLSYLCIKLLCGSVRSLVTQQNKRIFVPIVRIHEQRRKTDKSLGDQANAEDILRSMSKVLAHILSSEENGYIIASAQGFSAGVIKSDSNDSAKMYKLSNGLNSLYGPLPKAFTVDDAPALDRVALIIVSSRKSDVHIDSPDGFHLSNIYGEVIGIEHVPDTRTVQLSTLQTFSANETSEAMYHMPVVLSNQARRCYELGYRHILYIAHAPYTSSLLITSAEKDEDQFFMSNDVIEALKGDNDDLFIYPMYCDKFYVIKINGKVEEALYIDDTSELRQLYTDPNRSAVVFFNLFNGISVNPRNQKVSRVYNGVISYSTLVNVYDDPTYDQAIRNNLLDGNQAGSYKKDILDFLTYLHFARFEKGRNVSLKLDPYDNIIGPDSVGTLSQIPHFYKGPRFNMLAFLTEVRGALNRTYSGRSSRLTQQDGENDEEQKDEEEK